MRSNGIKIENRALLIKQPCLESLVEICSFSQRQIECAQFRDPPTVLYALHPRCHEPWHHTESVGGDRETV